MATTDLNLTVSLDNQVDKSVPVSPISPSSASGIKNTTVAISEIKQQDFKEKTLAPVEQVLIGEESNLLTSHDDHMEAESDPLDLGDLNESSCYVFSSDEESDNTKTDKRRTKIELSGCQLYKCAFCDTSCATINEFKKHALKSMLQCTSSENPTKPYMCFHCKKKFRNPYVLCDHIQCHGVLRFTCSLCENKFPTTTRAR